MTDEHFDQAFERVRTELNVTPSPEFVVKVRQQNEQLSVRSSWRLWAWTGAAATCAAAVIAIVLWRTPAPKAQIVQERPRESFSSNRKPQEAFSEPAKMTPRVSKRAKTTPEVVVAAAAMTTELEVLVPPDQLIAIRQLMSSMRKGADVRVAPSTPTLIDPDTGELMKPTPIEIPLITVTPLPGVPEGRSGGRENR